MSKLKIALLVVGILVIAFVIIVATRPADFRVTRSTTIAAPPDSIFAQVNDLHNWQAWSPWAKLDPNAKMTYEGPAAGIGAGYTWDGNKEVGAGRMTITESQPGERVGLKLEFLKPFKATNGTEFTFKPAGNGTTVTWSMYGKNNFMFKAVSLFME